MAEEERRAFRSHLCLTEDLFSLGSQRGRDLRLQRGRDLGPTCIFSLIIMYVACMLRQLAWLPAQVQTLVILERYQRMQIILPPFPAQYCLGHTSRHPGEVDAR